MRLANTSDLKAIIQPEIPMLKAELLSYIKQAMGPAIHFYQRKIRSLLYTIITI